MRKITALLVESCRTATFLVEKSYSDPLSFMDKVKLSMHLKICAQCSRYQKQSFLIENLLRANHHNRANLPDLRLSEGFKTSIEDAIQEFLKNK